MVVLVGQLDPKESQHITILLFVSHAHGGETFDFLNVTCLLLETVTEGYQLFCSVSLDVLVGNLLSASILEVGKFREMPCLWSFFTSLLFFKLL